MNPSDLTGRDLDLAVARALGWKPPSDRGCCDACGWPIVPDGEMGCWAGMCSMRPAPAVRADAPGAFGSNPQCIPELFAEIAARTWSWVSLRRTSRIPADYDATCCRSTDGMSFAAFGSTPNEALARLLLMVTQR